MAGIVPGLQLTQEIGRGHFGVVYLGADSVHGQVAVKVLQRKSRHTDAEWLAYKTSFLAEAQNLSKATHRNVVQVYHIEELPDGNSIRFCMAYCPGGSLQSAYVNGPMTLPAVLKAGTEVLLGLAALHSRQMLHRDIKPGNILIGADGVALIGDFGLVTDDLVLGYGSHAGYKDHLAYELWTGKGTSVRSDIWAFGMTLFRLLHGESWYHEASEPKTIIEAGRFVDTLEWLPHIPKTWRRVIRRMLHDDPASRHQSANQALEALSRLPVDEVWNVEVADERIRWQRTVKARRNVVEWLRVSPRKHTWIARSEPIGKGRIVTLGGSGELVKRSDAVRGLEKYFAV